jgi:hypothetical protein
MNVLESDEVAKKAITSLEATYSGNLFRKIPSFIQDDPCQRKHCGAGRVCQVLMYGHIFIFLKL